MFLDFRFPDRCLFQTPPLHFFVSYSLSTPLLLCIFFYLPSFLCKETLLLPPQATAAAAAAAGALKHMWSKMYLLNRACIFSLSIPASLSCSTPKGSESQLSVLSLFAMEGCRYKGMQCRLPEVSQWMDREEKSMCAFCVRLQSSFALAHTNHYMIKSSYCITQKTQIHPDGGHPCYICNLEHILLHSRAPDTHLQCTPRPLQHHQLKSQMYGHGCINSVLAQISNSHTQSNSPDHRSHGTLKDQQTVRSYKFYIKISVHTVWVEHLSVLLVCSVLFSLQVVTLCAGLGLRRIMQVPWLTNGICFSSFPALSLNCF